MHAVMGSGRLIAGRYRLQGPIGRGAMGIVWRSRDELLARDVAVKEVQIAAYASPADAEAIYQRTLREARAAARLSHPSVVTVFDVVEENGSPWIVMELVNARSLDRVITEDGPLPPLQAAELGASLVDALASAHAAGVLHRDVKPSNVLVAEDGRAVLTDFGIATFAGDPGNTQVGMVVGTPGYTAPERVRGGAATPASDLWSLGATLYAAVEGRGPFDRAGGATAITAGVMTQDAPQAPSAGPLGPVIDALLSRDPAARPDASTAARLLTESATTASRRIPREWPTAQAELASSGDELVADPLASALALNSGVALAGSAGLAAVEAAAGVVSLEPAGLEQAGSGPIDGAPADQPESYGPVLWEPLKPPAGAGGGGAAGGSTGPGGADPGGFGTGGSGTGGSGPGGFGTGGSGPGGFGAGGSGTGGSGDDSGLGFRWRGGGARPASRRWTLIVAIGGVVAIVLAAFIGWDVFSRGSSPQALGSATVPGITVQGSGAGQSGASAPGAASKSSGTPTVQPTPTRSGGSTSPSSGQSGKASPSTSASSGSTSPSSSPSPSHSPSASPSPTPTSTSPALPPGYVWHRFTAAAMGSTAGFEIGMPALWGQSVTGLSANLSEPVTNFHLTVNLAHWTYAGALAEAQYLQSKYAKADPGYKLLALAAIGFKSIGGFEAASAAELKFKWTKPSTGSVTDLVVLVTLTTKSGVQPYSFTLWAPSATFSLADGVLLKAMPTFRPLPR